MSKLKEFNKPALRELRSEMEIQFAKLEKKFGIKLHVGSKCSELAIQRATQVK